MYTVSAGSDVGAEVAAAEALVVEERHCASGICEICLVFVKYMMGIFSVFSPFCCCMGEEGVSTHVFGLRGVGR